MSEASFQTCRSSSTPGEIHITWSGHKTPCDKSVIEANPFPDSRIKDVTCSLCGAWFLFDMEAAHKAAVDYVRAQPGTARWDEDDIREFAPGVADRVAKTAWDVRGKHGEWNTNHVFSEFMANNGLMTDPSPEARLIGRTAQAVLEVLTEKKGR